MPISTKKIKAIATGFSEDYGVKLCVFLDFLEGILKSKTLSITVAIVIVIQDIIRISIKVYCKSDFIYSTTGAVLSS